MAQDTHSESKKGDALKFLASILETKTEAKSQKMPSKVDAIVDVRFGRRFFTLGVDFGPVLGRFLEGLGRFSGGF